MSYWQKTLAASQEQTRWPFGEMWCRRADGLLAWITTGGTQYKHKQCTGGLGLRGLSCYLLAGGPCLPITNLFIWALIVQER